MKPSHDSPTRVLTQATIGKPNRTFEAPELIDAFTALERQLASPEAETRNSPPARRVPRATSTVNRAPSGFLPHPGHRVSA